MIPKIIHYCWFGRGDKPKSVLNCIASWRTICPDYTIKEWNEDNFDIRANQYISEAYDSRKYAFVSDYARLYALFNEGGIYLDTDVEIKKTFDNFLHHSSFIGFESPIHIQTGVMASVANVEWVSYLLEEYKNRVFITADGKLDTTTNVVKTTEYFIQQKLITNGKHQSIANCEIYPEDFFCAKDHRTGVITQTKNTVCIHHYEGSWIKNSSISNLKHWLKLQFAQLFGGKITTVISNIITGRIFKSK
ncbi:MAG: glycosyltransferase [Rikenellaceae bacterium]